MQLQEGETPGVLAARAGHKDIADLVGGPGIASQVCHALQFSPSRTEFGHILSFGFLSLIAGSLSLLQLCREEYPPKELHSQNWNMHSGHK